MGAGGCSTAATLTLNEIIFFNTLSFCVIISQCEFGITIWNIKTMNEIISYQYRIKKTQAVNPFSIEELIFKFNSGTKETSNPLNRVTLYEFVTHEKNFI